MSAGETVQELTGNEAGMWKVHTRDRSVIQRIDRVGTDEHGKDKGQGSNQLDQL